MLTMEEILNIVPTWTKVEKDTQLAKGPVWIDAIIVEGKAGDASLLYEGTGTTGKSIKHMPTADNITERFEIGAKFNDGLYIDAHANMVSMIIIYRVLPN